MIIVKIQHGLGNQMFQYAFGRAMAEKNGTELKLDISYYAHPNKNDTPRKYGLGCFNIVENFAGREDIKRFGANNLSGAGFFTRVARKLFRKFENRKPVSKRNYLSENDGVSWREALQNENKNIYLYGGWQNENYFTAKGGFLPAGQAGAPGENGKCAEHIIRREFTLKDGFGREAARIAEKIKSVHSVSIHIRRGDYESNPKTKAYLGALPKEYYLRAMSLISEKIPSPVFFVFSDDIAWAKKELKTEYPVEFVSDDGINDCEEMALMSLCEHNIIANSSFSWWGAWLNNNPNKIVIAPEKWFIEPKKKNINLCPENWTKI